MPDGAHGSGLTWRIGLDYGFENRPFSGNMRITQTGDNDMTTKAREIIPEMFQAIKDAEIRGKIAYIQAFCVDTGRFVKNTTENTAKIVWGVVIRSKSG